MKIEISSECASIRNIDSLGWSTGWDGGPRTSISASIHAYLDHLTKAQVQALNRAVASEKYIKIWIELEAPDGPEDQAEPSETD